MKYNSQEFSLELPPEWEDRTMFTFVAPFVPGGFASNVVITRHVVGPTKSIEDFAQEQQQIMRDSLPGFVLLDQRATQVNGAPAFQQLHRFSSDYGVLQQAQTFVLGVNTIFVITCSATLQDFDSQITAFRKIVKNFSLVNLS